MKKIDKLFSLLALEEIEPGALQQIFENLSDDRVLKMAIMPDVHQGYDLPIGGVALVDRHICPSYVGYDIGCGMCAVNTGILATDILPDRPSRERLFAALYRTISRRIRRNAAIVASPILPTIEKAQQPVGCWAFVL